MRQLVGDAFMRPFEQGSRIQSNQSLARNRNMRTDLMPMQVASRIEYQRQRLKQMDERIRQSQDRLNELQRQFNAKFPYYIKGIEISQRNSDLKAQQLDQNNKAYDLRARKAGVAQQTDFPTGESGMTTLLTQKDMSKMQDVINAWPQMKSVLAQIQQGAKYFVNNPDGLKKYMSALSATWTGHASKGQEKLLEQVGVSSNAIVQLQELQMSLMNLPKLQDTYNATEALFTPHKGETVQSFMARTNAVTRDNALRYHQAIFNTQFGVPADNNAEHARDNYVTQQLANDPFLKQNQQDFEAMSQRGKGNANSPLMPSSPPPPIMSGQNGDFITTKAGNQIPMDSISQYAKSNNMSLEDAISHASENF
ncbi:hypothetical protein [Nitrospira sp. BLG_2]|uniref:hypothetical protein n=1 Tax=Nitrospira sp. BLG_2 TaxID=3397507 RepID=UPI003B9BB7C5